MVINTNVPSAFASRVLAASTHGLAKSLAKLSSGSRIVSADDDTAGLAVSMKFNAEIKRIGGARTNVGNSVSFSQTQDGYMGTIDKALRRMSELATLAGDQTKANDDVAQYEKEFSELKSFITRTSTKTFNSIGLFSSTTLKDKNLTSNYNADGTDITTDAGDAQVLTTYNSLTTSNTSWAAEPVRIASSGASITGNVNVDTDTFTKTSHGMTTGEKVTVTSVATAVTGGVTAGDVRYVKFPSSSTFELYTDKELTTANKVNATGAAAATGDIVMTRSGHYDLLQDLRKKLGDLAREWLQFEASSTTETDYTGTTSSKTWADVYDFWSSRTGTTWSGVRAHTDTYTTGLAPGHEVHVGNASSLSDSLITAYKQFVADVQSYINNKGAGITITDSSDATTFQLKGADLTKITNAISNASDTNSINSTLLKTNAGTYVTKLSTLINELAGSRAYVGANISRLQAVDSQLAVYGENLSAANSRIEDVDVATESAVFARQQILVQSGTAMLAQANVISQSALKLLS